MRLLVVDPFGDGLDVAVRAQKDGHDVRYFVRNKEENKNIGVGFVERVDDFRKWIVWADVVFAVDNTLYVRDLSNARGAGHKGIICATESTTAWETDRSMGQKVLRRAGIPTIPFREFQDYDSAIAYVKKHDQPYVSKPSDEEDKALSYVAKSPEDLVYMLQRWKRLGKLKAPFILQELVKGCEMAVGAFYGRGGFSAWCENWEFKKLMNNDLGVATGEQGTVLRFVSGSKLARKVLKPIEPQLEKEDYIGYIDVNCIIDEKGVPWPLEFTMRPGWPTYNIQLALCKGDSAQWLLDLTEGKTTDTWTLNSVAVGVVLSIPDYPYSNVTKKEVTGIPIYGIEPALWKHVHMAEMMIANDIPCRDEKEGMFQGPCPATAGDYVLIMTATGPSVSSAAKTVYRRLDSLIVPNSPMYRTDIGRRLATQLPQIQAHNYASSMSY